MLSDFTNAFFKRASVRLFITSLFVFFSFQNAMAQPSWVAGTPSVDPFALYADLNYGLDQEGTVYGLLVRGTYTTPLTTGYIRSRAYDPVTFSRPAALVLSVGATDVGNTLIERIYNQYSGGYLDPNTTYTLVLTADDLGGNLADSTYITFTTPPCPSIFVTTGLNNADRCVNGDGATKVYNFITGDGAGNGASSGILEGATWTIDWGDGTPAAIFHTSTTENDGPGVLVPGFGEYGTIQHTYNNHDDCFYVASLTVENQGGCAATGTLSESKISILHGRDIDTDGNADFIVDEVGTGVTDTIYVCEGSEYTTSIEDISTWDCQPDIYYPNDLPGLPTGETNEDPRFLQWVYGGASPDGSLEAPANTITGNVVIGGLGTITSGGAGIIGDTVRADAPTLNISAPITIPATAQEGEEFKIYYKNWNKCNLFSGTEYDNTNYIETEIVILIIHAPDPPIAPDVEDCFGSVGPLTAAATEGGTLTWYSDAALTTIVGTGGTYNHGHTAVGTYTYYVTESLPTCEGPPTEVTLTINPLPDNTLPVSDDATCEGDDVDIVVSGAISGTRYWLRNDANNAILSGPSNGGDADLTFTITPAGSMTANVLAEIIATGCQDELLDLSTITVNEYADITSQPVDREICELDGTTFTVVDDGNPAVTAHLWQVSSDGGSNWVNASGANYADETTGTLTLTNVPLGFDGNMYRCILTTGGPCTIISDEVDLTVNGLPPDRNVIADDPYMCFGGSTDIVVQNAQAGIDYTLRIGTTDQATLTGTGANLQFPVGPLNADVTYNVLATDPGVGCPRQLADQPDVTINPEISVNVPNIDDICVDTDVNLPRIQRSGGSGTWSYDWTGTGGYTSTDRDPAPFTTAITGTHSYTATVTDEGFLTTSTAGGDPTTCTASDTESFDVFPLPIDRNVTIDHTQICYNTGTTVNVESSEAGITYELWDNALATSYGSQVGDGTTLNFPTGNLTSDVTFRVLATSPTTPACSFELTDNPAVTVNPLLGVVAGVDDNNICEGTTIDLTATPSGGSGSYTFAWTGPDGFNTTTEDPSDTPTSEGLPHTYSVTVTDDGFTPTAPLAACTSTDNINVTVNLNPAVNVTAPASICTNVTLSLDGDVTPGTGSTITHLWTGDTAPLSATDEEEPDFLTTVPNSYNLTYRATDENGCYDEGTTTISVSGPTADILADGISSETAGICDNTNLALDGNPTPNPTAIDNTTHRWTEGTVASAGQLTPMGPGATAETPVFNSGVQGDYTYYYEVQDMSGCFAYDTITITVSQVNASPLPAAPEPCAGNTVNIDGNPSGGSGVYSIHTWTEDVGNPEAGTLVDGNTQTPDFTATTPGTYSFDYYVEDNAGCNYTVVGYTIVVKPVPDLTDGINNTICSGDAANTALSISNGPLVTTYAWAAPTYSDGSLSGGSAGSGATINDVLINNQTNSIETVTYSVTPTSDGCPGTPEDVVISVRPEPVITAGQSDTECSDIALDHEILLDNFASGSGVTFTWAAPTVTGGITGGNARGPSPGTDANITDTYNNISSSSQTATYTVTPTYNTCEGSPEDIVFTIDPEPVITPGQNPVVCSQEALDHFIALDNFVSGDGVMYSWAAPTLDVDPNFSGGTARPAPNAGNITDSYLNESSSTLTATYNITPTLGGCDGDQESLVVDVNPEPVITNGQIVTVCSGEALDIEILMDNFTNPGDNVTFTWTAPVLDADPDFSGGSARAIGSAANITDTYLNTSGVQLTATYTITPLYNGCEGDPETLEVRVNPEPQMTSGTAETICSSETPALVFTSDIAATYNWEVTFVGGGIIGTSLGETGSGNIPHALSNAGSTPSNVIYRVTPVTGAGCEGTPQNVTITVNAPATATETNPLLLIIAGDPTPAGSAGLEVTLGGAAVQGAPAGWIVSESFPGEGTFDDEYSLNPIFTPSANQEAAGYVILQYITNDPDGAIGPCLPDTAEVYINIGALPSANAGNDTTMCFESSIELVGYVGGAATTGTWTAIAGFGSGIMGPSTITDSTVRATYTFGADETGVDVITFRLETDDPDGAGPVPSAYDDKVVTINPLPLTTVINGEDTVCVNTSNLVYSTTLTPNSNYEWFIPASIGTLDFGGTGINSNMSIITSGAVGATDSIWVYETNQYGCTRDTVYKPVTVTEQSTPDPITGPITLCAGTENVTYSVPNWPGSTYQWFVPVGAAIVSDPSLNTIDVDFGQFSGQVRAIETNPGGCVTNHGPLDITINPLPVTTLNALPTAICQGENVDFTAGPAGQANYEFFVNGVSAQSGAAETFSTTTLSNGDQVTVIVTTAAACSAESSPVPITVYDNPTVSLAASATTICDETPVSFTATATNTVNYNFLVNGVSQQSGGANFFTSSTLADGDVVTVDVLSAFACPASSAPVNMTVHELPVAVIDGDYDICPGTTENISVNVSQGLSPYDITIDNGVGLISGYTSGTNIPVTPLSSTTYSLSQIVDANGCSSVGAPNVSGTAVINVYDTIRILTQPRDAEVCEGIDTSFTVGAFGTGISYEWFESNTQSGPYAAVAASNVATLDIISPTSAEDGTFYYVVVSGTCNAITSDTVELDIQYDPITARDPFDLGVCEGLPAGFGVDAGTTESPVFQWYVREDGSSPWQALLDTAAYTGSTSDSLIISSANSYMHEFEYYVEISGSCAGTASSAPATLSVYERPEILLQPDDMLVCENDPASFTIDAGVTASAVYQWQVDERGGSGFQDIAIDSAGIYSGHDAATLQVLDPGSRFNQYRYRALVSGLCTPSQTSNYATLTVNERPEVLVAPVSSEICEGQSTAFSVNAGVTTGVNYLWEVDMGSGFETIGMDTAIYNGHATATLILSAVPSSYDSYNYRVTVNGSCPPSITPAAVTLTVNENPEILIQPVNDTVCELDPALFMIDAGVSTNPVYQWQVNSSGLWTNLTAADETSGDYSGVFTATLTVNNPDLTYNNYRYRVQLSGSCSPALTSDVASLIVDTRPEITLQPADITSCEDSDIQFMLSAGNTTEAQYSWEYSPDNGGSWIDAATLPEVSVSNLANLDILSIPSAYDQYQFRGTVAGKCTAPVVSDVAIATILEKPEISIQPVDVTACENDTVIFTVEAGITSSPAYTWQFYNGAAWIAASSGIYSGVNNDTLLLNGISSGLNATAYRVVVSGACAPDSISEEVVLTVDERPEITLQPTDQEICENDNASFTISAGVTTAPLISWEYFNGSWNLADAGEGIFSNWDTPNLDLTAVPNTWDGTQFRAIVSNGCGPNDTSDVVTLIVNNRPVIDSQPVDVISCEGIAVAFGIDPGITTNPAFSWEVNDGINGWLPVSGGMYTGSNSDTLRIPNPISSMNGYQFRVVLSGTCTPSVTSDEVTLTINENAEITVQPVGDAICENDNTSFTVNPGVTTNPTYQWYVDSGSGMTLLADDANHSGSTLPTLDILNAPFSLDENQYQVIVSGDCGVPVMSDIIDLIVLKSPEITLEPQDTTTCESASVSFTIETGDTDSPVIQWFENDGSTGWQPLSNGGIYAGVNSTTLLVFTVDSAMNTYQYHAEVSNMCGGPITSVDATLTVQNPARIWEQPADLILCEGDPASFTVTATGSNLTYQWQVDMRDGNGYQDLADTANYSGSNGPVLQQASTATRFNGYRYRVVVNSSNCTPAQTSSYAELSINEVAEIITQPSDVVICEDQSTVFTVNAGVTTAPTYLWEVDMGSGFETIGADTGIYSGSATAALILSVVPSDYNSYLYRVTVGGICPDTETSVSALLSVNQVPEITSQPVNDTVCENDAAQFTVNPGVTTAASFQWQVNKFGVWENLTLADELSGDYSGVNAQVLDVNNPDISYNNYRYRAIVSGICSPAATSEAAYLVVDTRPQVIVDPVDRVLCEDEDVIMVVNAGSTTEPTYLWEYSSNGGGSWNDAAGLAEVSISDNDSLEILGVNSGLNDYLFRATVSGKCPAPAISANALMTINEKPEIIVQPLDITSCEYDTVAFIVDAGVTTSPIYNWQYYNGASWLSVPPTIYSGVSNDTLVINGISSSLHGTRYRVVVSGVCAPDSISEEAVLSVDERPEVLGVPLDQTICENEDTYFGISTGATTAPVVSWEYNDGSSWAVAGGGIFSTNAAGDTLYLTNVPALYDAYSFRAIVSNGCGPNDTSLVALLTVKNRPLILSEPVDETTCEGVPVSIGIDPGISSDPVYQWEYNNGSSWAPVFGAQYGGIGTDSLHILAPNSTMNGYQYRVILGGYCIPNDTSAVVTLTITEDAEITEQPVNADICELGDTAFYASPGVTTNPTFQWYVDDNSGSGFQAVSDDLIYSGATDSALHITAAPYTMNGYLYRLNVTGDCGSPVSSSIARLSIYKAPEISLQPTDTTTCELENVSFTIETGLTESPMIQWYEDSGSGMSAISDGGGYIGSNSATLQIFGVDSTMTTYQYEARITNSCGGPLTSDRATLTVLAAPNIWTQPENSTICEGTNTAFSVVATGEALTYEWFVDDGNGAQSIVDDLVYSGQGSPVLQLNGADRSYHLNRYYVRISGSCQPFVQSSIAILYVENPAEIVVEPVNDTVCEMSTASFSVSATGSSPVYQWQVDMGDGNGFQDLSDGGLYFGSNYPTLNIFSVDRTYDNYVYRAIVSGSCAPDAQSAEATLSVRTAPLITTHPSDAEVCIGEEAAFGVIAEGSELEYQWKVNRNDGFGYVDILDLDAEYTGALTDSLVKLVSNDLIDNGFSYRVEVSGYCMPPQLSNPALLSVNSAPSLNVQPVDRAICEGSSTTFSVSVSGSGLYYQWMLSQDGGTSWDSVFNDAYHDGAQSDELSILDSDAASMNANLYRLDISGACLDLSSNVVELTVWENPTAGIIGDLVSFPQLCGDDLMIIDGNPVGGSGSYSQHLWSGDTFPLASINTQSTEFRSTITGSYNISYKVTDSNGCFGQDVVTIENFSPSSRFITDVSGVCDSVSVSFTNQSSADATSFLWSFDDGSTSTELDPNHMFYNDDILGNRVTYTVILEAIQEVSPQLTCIDSSDMDVYVYGSVKPELTADPIRGCTPVDVYLEATLTADEYYWEFGDGESERGRYMAYHTYTNTGNTTATYKTVVSTITNRGCIASDTVEIMVDPIPQPNFTADPMVITEFPEVGNAIVTFTNLTDEGPWEFAWDFGDGGDILVTTSYDDIVHAYTQPDEYKVTLYVSSGDCLDSISTTILIKPRAPVAMFTCDTVGCHPKEISFTNLSKDATQYRWQFGDGYSSTEENPTHVFNYPGEFDVTLYVDGDGGSDLYTVEVTINPTPVVLFSWAPDSVFVKQGEVRFFNSTSFADEYYWDFGDVSTFDGEIAADNNSILSDPTHIYQFEGWRDVKLVAWNEFCIDSLFIPMAIKVIPAGELVFPNVFRPGRDPQPDVDVSTLDDESKNTIFYPGINKQVQEYHLYIYNRWGELIFESDHINTGWDGYIHDHTVRAPQGVYIWKVTGIYSNGSPFSSTGDVTLLYNWSEEE